MKNDHRYSIRITPHDSKLISEIAKNENIEKSVVVRFCISGCLKIAINRIPEELINPELAFISSAIRKV